MAQALPQPPAEQYRPTTIPSAPESTKPSYFADLSAVTGLPSAAGAADVAAGVIAAEESTQAPNTADVVSAVAIFIGITAVASAIGGYYGHRRYNRPLVGASVGAVVGGVPAYFASRAFLRARSGG